MATAFALAVDDFFIRQNRAKGRAPVHRRVGNIGESVLVLITANGLGAGRCHVGRNRQLTNRPTFAFSLHAIGARPFIFRVIPGVEDLQKDPLSPTVVIRICRREFSLPVVAEPEHLQLTLKRRDVLIRRFARVCACLDRVLFRWKSECIPTHWMQNIQALHPRVTADNIRRGVTFRMPHMQSAAGGVGEHVENV